MTIGHAHGGGSVNNAPKVELSAYRHGDPLAYGQSQRSYCLVCGDKVCTNVYIHMFLSPFLALCEHLKLNDHGGNLQIVMFCKVLSIRSLSFSYFSSCLKLV